MSNSATERTTGSAANGGERAQMATRPDGVHAEGVSTGTEATIGPTKKNVLAVLQRSGSLAPVELGEVLGFTAESMLRHCEELEKEGRLIRRRPLWVRVTIEVPDWRLGEVRREAGDRGFPVDLGVSPATSQDGPEVFDTFALNHPAGNSGSAR